LCIEIPLPRILGQRRSCLKEFHAFPVERSVFTFPGSRFTYHTSPARFRVPRTHSTLPLEPLPVGGNKQGCPDPPPVANWDSFIPRLNRACPESVPVTEKFISTGCIGFAMEPMIQIHNRYLATRKKNIQHWKIPPEEKKALIRFLDELELGKVNRGRKISQSRQCKYLDLLHVSLEFFGKSARALKVKDVEAFEKALATGRLQSRKGTPYLPATRVDMRRALKVYLRWRLGRTKADALTDWLDTRPVTKTPEFLKESEVEQLYKACKSAQERFLVAVLFDTGARATEFHNIRMEDVELPTGAQAYPKITLKEQYSKTKGRTVSLFWKHSVEAVTDFVRQREAEGAHRTEPVFVQSYPAARKFLLRLGKRVLGRSIHYHLFRHSSATYYADKMNRQQLCIRYGWTFSSRMPDVYIARAGVEMRELEDRFKAAEVESLKTSLVKVQQESRIKDERLRQLEETVRTMRREFAAIADLLATNPSVKDVTEALRRRRAHESQQTRAAGQIEPVETGPEPGL